MEANSLFLISPSLIVHRDVGLLFVSHKFMEVAFFFGVEFFYTALELSESSSVK